MEVERSWKISSLLLEAKNAATALIARIEFASLSVGAIRCVDPIDCRSHSIGRFSSIVVRSCNSCSLTTEISNTLFSAVAHQVLDISDETSIIKYLKLICCMIPEHQILGRIGYRTKCFISLMKPRPSNILN